MRRAVLLIIFLMLAAAIAAAARSTVVNTDEPTPYLIDNNVIPKIICGQWAGTGVYVGEGLIATARHLVKSGHCRAAGIPASLVAGSIHAGSDFALLSINGRASFRALIDCGGFHEGQLYLATGYAEDAQATVTQVLTGSSSRSGEKGFAGMGIFRGSVTQGMSGGPIVRLDNGALVGVISANSEDGITAVLGVPLSETMLCPAHKQEKS
jgi:hypothetical protein